MLVGDIKKDIFTKTPKDEVERVKRMLRGGVITQDAQDVIVNIYKEWKNLEQTRNTVLLKYEWLPASIYAELPSAENLADHYPTTASRTPSAGRSIADVYKNMAVDVILTRLRGNIFKQYSDQRWRQILDAPSEDMIDWLLREALPKR